MTSSITHSALSASRRTATALAGVRLQGLARAKGVRVHVDLKPGARFAPGAEIEIERGNGAPITLAMAPGATIEKGALLRLTAGARLTLGPDVLIRRHSVLNVSGDLTLRGENLISWGSVIHCAEQVTFDRQAGTGDCVTVVDGAHHRGDDDRHWYHQSSTAPVHVGPNVWLASHSTITKGVTIGASATVAAGSVVLADVPAGSVVAGAPARVVTAPSVRRRV